MGCLCLEMVRSPVVLQWAMGIVRSAVVRERRPLRLSPSAGDDEGRERVGLISTLHAQLSGRRMTLIRSRQRQEEVAPMRQLSSECVFARKANREE
jgi:hypothetical protein